MQGVDFASNCERNAADLVISIVAYHLSLLMVGDPSKIRNKTQTNNRKNII